MLPYHLHPWLRVAFSTAVLAAAFGAPCCTHGVRATDEETNRHVDAPVANAGESDFERLREQLMATIDRMQMLGRAIERRELRLTVGRRSVPFVFRYVPAGETEVGISEQTRVAFAAKMSAPAFAIESTPNVPIRFEEGFFMLEGELTWRQYRLVVPEPPAASPNDARQPLADVPCGNLTWWDAVDFCAALSNQTGLDVRLPTEIEWEYALRGPDAALFAEGNAPPVPFIDEEQQEFVAVVGGTSSSSPQPLTLERSIDTSWCGVRDLSGNLSEWCLNDYTSSLAESFPGPSFRSSEVVSDDWLIRPASVRRCAFRGANYADRPVAAIAALRRYLVADHCEARIGFRPIVTFRLGNLLAVSAENDWSAPQKLIHML